MTSLTVSAGAVDIYSTNPEAEPLLKSSSLMSTFDSGISTAAVEPSDLDDFLTYGNGTVAQWLNYIYWFLNGSGTAYRPTTTLPDILTGQSNILTSISNFLYSSGSYLDYDGDLASTGQTGLAEYVRKGLLGLSTNIKAVTTAIQSLDFNDYSSILSSIYSSVDGLESGLTSVNTAIGGVTTAVNNVTTAVNNVRTAVNNVVSGLSTVNTSVGTVNTSLNSLLKDEVGWHYLSQDGNLGISTGGNNIPALLGSGFLGLRNYLDGQFKIVSGLTYLNASGNNAVVQSPLVFSDISRYGFMGLAHLIKGSEVDNEYVSTLYDNNNVTSTVRSVGLGPLLNNRLSNIGENLGHLAYVFASDDEIKLKQDSEPIMEEVGSIYDDSDSKVKVNADGIGGVKNVVGEFGDFLEVDAGIDDVITIVTNPQSYAWLTQDTLNNLDTVGVSTFSRGESWHDRLYSEFYEEYFPERVD